jgi:hypothetical protein
MAEMAGSANVVTGGSAGINPLSRMARKMDLLETAAGLFSWSLRLRIIN